MSHLLRWPRPVRRPIIGGMRVSRDDWIYSSKLPCEMQHARLHDLRSVTRHIRCSGAPHTTSRRCCGTIDPDARVWIGSVDWIHAPVGTAHVGCHVGYHVILCSPNEDCGRRRKRSGVYFRCTLQGCEYLFKFMVPKRRFWTDEQMMKMRNFD